MLFASSSAKIRLFSNLVLSVESFMRPRKLRTADFDSVELRAIRRKEVSVAAGNRCRRSARPDVDPIRIRPRQCRAALQIQRGIRAALPVKLDSAFNGRNAGEFDRRIRRRGGNRRVQLEWRRLRPSSRQHEILGAGTEQDVCDNVGTGIGQRVPSQRVIVAGGQCSDAGSEIVRHAIQSRERGILPGH